MVSGFRSVVPRKVDGTNSMLEVKGSFFCVCVFLSTPCWCYTFWRVLRTGGGGIAVRLLRVVFTVMGLVVVVDPWL